MSSDITKVSKALVLQRLWRRCNLTATKKFDNRRVVAAVAARLAIGRHSNSVTACLLSMHKRLAVTDLDRWLVAKVADQFHEYFDCEIFSN